jgi:hypothetical protein
LNASEPHAGTSGLSPVSQQAMKKYVRPAKEAAPHSVSVQDSINMDVLHVMKDSFAKADADGSGELGPDEFVKAFSGA